MKIGVVTGIVFGICVVVIFVLVPWIVRAAIGIAPAEAKNWRERVLLRYERAGLPTVGGTFAWVFAWFKMRLDPMFGELPGFLGGMGEIRRGLDIGCGFGVAGCALLEWRGEMRIFGVDPEWGRVRVAGAVFGERGKAIVGSAPEFDGPGMPDRFDAVFILDVIHFMPDSGFELTLRKVRERLEGGGYLVIRAIIPPEDGGSWAWKFAKMRRAMTGGYACHRPVEKITGMIARAGFDLMKTEISGGNPELVWFIARAGLNELHNEEKG